MKLNKAFLVLCFALLLVGVPLSGFAQVTTLPDPGTLPDSSLYFLKSWKESIQLFFTFDVEKKATQYIHLAEVRLAEYQKMIEKGKQEIADKTLMKYEDQLKRALQKAEEFSAIGGSASGGKSKNEEKANEVKTKIEEATAKHLQVFQENLAKAPEAAKKGLEKAIKASQKGMEKVREAIEKKEQNSQTPTMNKPTAFNLIFRYGVGAKNELNTFNNTFTKDMVIDPPITVNLKLSNNEFESIYQKINKLKLFNKGESTKSSQPNVSVIPCSSYYLNVQDNSNQKELFWDNCRGRISDKFQQFTDFIILIIKSKEEYKKLPPTKGGYI